MTIKIFQDDLLSLKSTIRSTKRLFQLCSSVLLKGTSHFLFLSPFPSPDGIST